jgi:carboxypeptidase PM20D1
MITLLIICLTRALLFKPKKETPTKKEPVLLDKTRPIKDLQALIQCRTVSFTDHSLEDDKEFDKLEATLKAHYPEVFKQGHFEKLGKREFLFHIIGKSEDKNQASILMAHFDVVDVVRENWKEDPFAGVIKDGILYGRGTIDTKGTLNGVMCSLDQLLAQGFVPEHDIYCAFAGDEEVQGGSARLAVDYFKEHNIDPLIVVDEGGGVVDSIFPGVSKEMAVIGTAEKGAVSLEFHLDGEGGHASAPAQHTPVGKLAMLACAIENDPYKMNMSKPVKEMFDILGRESTFKYRFIFANLWLFKPILNSLTIKTGGQLNALVRTTTALTEMKGAPVTNVIPSEAMLGLNMRLQPGDDCKEAEKRLMNYAKKLKINVTSETLYSWNASRVSRSDVPGFAKMKEAIKETWGDETIVTPFIMTACSDSRWYGVISDKVYRFSAMRLKPEQLHMIHGDNESLADQQIQETVEFYYRLIKTL